MLIHRGRQSIMQTRQLQPSEETELWEDVIDCSQGIARIVQSKGSMEKRSLTCRCAAAEATLSAVKGLMLMVP